MRIIFDHSAAHRQEKTGLRNYLFRRPGFFTIGSTKNGAKAGLNNAFVYNGHPYIRFDPSHHGQSGWFRGSKQPIDYSHVNFDKMPNSNWLYDQIQSRYNHYPLSDDAYNVLKDLKSAGKKVRIAGKVLLVAGVVLGQYRTEKIRAGMPEM